MNLCELAGSPVEANHKPRGDIGDLVNKTQYLRLVGRLICLSHTRLDVAYSVIVE